VSLSLPSEKDRIIARLGLLEHPEGGWYRETLRTALTTQTTRGERALVTLIYYLLPRGITSRVHRVAWDETWIFQAGGELNLQTHKIGAVEIQRLGIAENCLPQITIPAGTWFNADVASGDYVLAACLVSPGFEFADLEMR
jgi:uncharacterized protein